MRRWLPLVVLLALAGCAGPPQGDPSPAALGDHATESPADWSGATRRVPSDYPTIQAAVDSADPGDLVLIASGVYREEVQVSTPGLILRGEDRNEVVIDGEFVRPNGIIVFADGVVVENLTLANATENGVIWTGVRGYRGSYLTAVDNQVYGIYAFDSGDGLFEHSYASGSPDAGFYIGQCDPCEAVITDSIAEWNGLGFSGTNASGELYLVNSVWRHNVAGIVPNTLDTELLPPFHDVTIAGNLIHDNGNAGAPSFTSEWSGYGNGVILAGGNDSLVTRNRIFNHPANGVAITPNLSRNFWMSGGNRVESNVIEGSGRADVALAGPASVGNCFGDNGDATSLPVGLDVFQSCDGLRLPVLFELAGSTEQLGRIAESELGWKQEVTPDMVPKPGPQPGMPGGAEAPPIPAVEVFAGVRPDVSALPVPDMPADTTVDQERGIKLFGVLFASAAGIFFGLYAYLLPFALYAAWVGLALWDLARRDDLVKGAIIGWTAAILLVPFLGVIIYHLFSRSPIPRWQRITYVLGGLAAYLVILGVGALVGGIV
ncbi:MAG TPA: right-handed parallel beta-helix repeat-containing protein [Acidimicrobiia bacterium]|nr:right-handed parallel beta-helix repeat-containing protein [Acidimicrobiia bacterium]